MLAAWIVGLDNIPILIAVATGLGAFISIIPTFNKYLARYLILAGESTAALCASCIDRISVYCFIGNDCESAEPSNRNCLLPPRYIHRLSHIG